MKYFIANWKAKKNLSQIDDWVKIFSEEINENPQLLLKLTNNQIKIIICPPFSLLSSLKNKLPKIPNLFLGSQDVSQFDEGSFTGEITAKNLADFVNYTIIGHSERRKFLNETKELLVKKTSMAKRYHLEPIFCIRDNKDFIPTDCQLIAYEPVAAIGTGQNEPPERVISLKKKLKLPQKNVFIYGGSVDENNAQSYLSTNEIDGFLIGSASLDPQQFYEIIKLG